MYSLQVDTHGLLGWATAYEATRLAQVYSVQAARIKEREQVVLSMEAGKHAYDLAAAIERASSKQPPLAPKEVSVDNNMEESRIKKEQLRDGSAFLFSWFYGKVRNRGDWDYKKEGYEFEDFGNFHYGAVGTAAGISEGILLRAAGAAQSIAGTSLEEFGHWWADAPYGDDDIDQTWIKAGIDYAKSKGY